MAHPHPACSLITDIIALVLGVVLIFLHIGIYAFDLDWDIDITQKTPYSALLGLIVALSGFHTIVLIYGTVRKAALCISDFLECEKSYAFLFLLVIHKIHCFWLTVIVVPTQLLVHYYAEKVLKELEIQSGNC
jgi:hypothetical protein